MALLLGLAFALGSAGCTSALCQASALDPWFDKLAHIRSISRDDRPPLHIMQIGDSHTAGDSITGAWRDILQAQYGSGGRGVMAAGRPYTGYVAHGVTTTMSPGWQVKATFGASSALPRPSIGVSGFSLTSQVDNATIGLVADANEAFDRFVVCALTGPGAGTLSIRIGFTTTEMDLGSFAARPVCKTIRTPEIQYNVQIVAHGGPTTITSWASFRDNGGIALSNLGVVGAQLQHFSRTDDLVLAEEFRTYKPDLIVLAFGTNEGFTPRFSPFEYEVTLRSEIGRLRRLAGNVPILMLSAPDAATRNIALRDNGPGPAVDCNDQPESLAEIMASIKSNDTPGAPPMTTMPSTPPISRSLVVPAAMASVRDVQRKVAAQLGVAFWDWQGRMGGACTSNRWVHANPPLMRGDFVHYTLAGGREIARMLQADLTAAAIERRP